MEEIDSSENSSSDEEEEGQCKHICLWGIIGSLGVEIGVKMIVMSARTNDHNEHN